MKSKEELKSFTYIMSKLFHLRIRIRVNNDWVDLHGLHVNTQYHKINFRKLFLQTKEKVFLNDVLQIKTFILPWKSQKRWSIFRDEWVAERRKKNGMKNMFIIAHEVIGKNRPKLRK